MPAGAPPPLFLLLLALGAGATVACIALAAASAGSAGRRFRQRIERTRERGRGEAPEDRAVASLRRARPSGVLGALEGLVTRLTPHPARLQETLAQAGIRSGLGAYGLAALGVSAAAALAALAAGLSAIAAMLVGVAAGLGLPHLVVRRLVRRRAHRFVALFPEAIELIVRGVKSGLPVGELVGTVAAEIPDPVGGEFRRVREGMAFGQTLEEALWASAGRVDAPEFRFFVVALSVQRETGGNLAETLENLADILRRRRQMKLKVRAMSSEARASAYILGALPFIMMGLLLLLNSAYVLTLFTDPRGHMMLGFGAGTMLVGALVMARMVRFEI